LEENNHAYIHSKEKIGLTVFILVLDSNTVGSCYGIPGQQRTLDVDRSQRNTFWEKISMNLKYQEASNKVFWKQNVKEILFEKKKFNLNEYLSVSLPLFLCVYTKECCICCKIILYILIKNNKLMKKELFY